MEWREFHPQYEINPMDHVGELHNTRLEHFIKNIDNVDVSLNSLQKIDIDIFAIGLSAFEKDTIWMMNSIARHSSAYWVSAKNDPDSPWINVLSDRGCDFSGKNCPNWFSPTSRLHS